MGWVGGDGFDPGNILDRSCTCPSAFSVRSPDFTNFSPFVVCDLSEASCSGTFFSMFYCAADE